MRRHAKASTAGSTQRQATGLGRFVRGALATRGDSLDSKESGAPAAGRLSVSAAAFGVLTAMLVAVALIVTPASASKTHVFKELFGSAAQPTFSAMGSIAIDQSSGDILLMDSTNGAKVFRFNPDGTPDDFSALGTNVIDGEGGADLTPQSGLAFDPAQKSQIAVDNSGGATDGNIYVTQNSPKLVNVFSKTGAYLGQLTAAGVTSFSEACGVAVDSSGAVYVGDYTAGIHKFVPAANPPINADHTATFTTTTEPCNLAAGVGSTAGFLFPIQYEGPLSKIDSGTGELKYTVSAGSHRAVAVDPGNGHVYGATDTTVEEFDASGAGSATSVSSIAVDGSGAQTTGAAASVHGVAVHGSTGDIYVTRFSTGGIKIEVFDAAVLTFPDSTTSAATAVGAGGATLNGTVNPDGQALTECVFEWGETTSYGNTAPCVPSAAGVGSGTSPVAVSADVSGLDVATPYHYRLKAVNANGALTNGVFGADMGFQTVGPRIAATWAQDVTRTEAFLRAEIDPEEVATTYHFEYGTTEAYGHQTPEFPAGSDSSVHVLSRFIEGLEPATTYHYKVVATSADGVNESGDRTLTTFAPLALDTDCPNQAFRGGASAVLPDCRAYEMVSPIEKKGTDIVSRSNGVGASVASDQAAIDGDKLAYSAISSFGDAQSSLYSNQFMASRGSDGWSTHSINPPHEHTVQGFVDPFQAPERFSAFTPDLSTGFVFDNAKPPLTLDALTGGFNNFYLRNNLNDTYKALTIEEFLSSQPQFGGLGGMGFMGYSEDGSHVLFASAVPLTPDSSASPSAGGQLYDYHDGELELVSVLPNGQPAENGSAGNAGSAIVNGPSANYADERGETDQTISDDDSRIFWMNYQDVNNVGKLYVRIDGETTVPISESVSPDYNASYWTASDDGSKVIFSVGSENPVDADLYEFDVDTETPNLIAGEMDIGYGVLGASDDASHVYFISREDLASGATAGQPNLYLDHEGDKTFIATLATGDEIGPAPTANNGVRAAFGGVMADFSQVTPDGRRLVFQSRANLTGYDNTSANTGDPAIEIYRYDAGTEQLDCVSCNPSGGRPQTSGLRVPYVFEESGGNLFAPAPQAAAWLPTPRRTTHIPRMVAADGNRIFFNAYDALVLQDANGAQDVYEWVAQGLDGCQEADGCVSLISTGKNPEKSTFIDASEGAKDVFFRTSASIDPDDPGLIDIYDARRSGGFPILSPPPPCVGDACQSVPPPPNDPTPASAGFRGAGDPPPAKPRRRSCRARSRKAKKGTQAARKAVKNCKRKNRRAGR